MQIECQLKSLTTNQILIFWFDLILIWLKNVKTLAKIWIRISQGLIARVNSYWCFTDFFSYRPPPASTSTYSDRSRWVLSSEEMHLTTSVHSFPLKNHLQAFPLIYFSCSFFYLPTFLLIFQFEGQFLLSRQNHFIYFLLFYFIFNLISLYFWIIIIDNRL